MKALKHLVFCLALPASILITSCEFKTKKSETGTKESEKKDTVKKDPFDTLNTKGTFTDNRDNITYKTVKVGNQVWMAENLKYVTKKGSMCLSDDEKNGKLFGRLYELQAAKAACPKGWHLPSELEWDTLLKALGGYGRDGYQNMTIGGASGFNIYLSGAKGSDGLYDLSTNKGCYWTSTIFDKNKEPVFIFFGRMDNKIVTNTAPDKKIAFSVRCIKDKE